MTAAAGLLTILLPALATWQDDFPPPKVEVVKLSAREFHSVVEVLGEVDAVLESRPGAEVDGRVASLEADAGDRVESGAPLLHIDTGRREIDRRRAAAELLLAQEQLREYLNGSRPEDVREAQAAHENAVALKEEADLEVTRLEGLIESGTVSQREYTAAKATALVAKALVDEKLATLDRILAGPREEALARARAQVEIRAAELATIEDDIERSVVRAPFAGVVISREVETGEFVRRGDPVFELVQIDPIRVVVPVRQEIVSRIRVGESLALRIPALGSEPFEGRIEAIVPRADKLARTFPVRVLLDNSDGRLLPGMVGLVRFPAGSREPVLAVPHDALIASPRGTVLYVVRDGLAARVPVQTGRQDEGWVEVSGELEPGEHVVVRGNERLMPDQPVEVVRGGDAP